VIGGRSVSDWNVALDPSVINSNFAKTGQQGAAEAGQVASLTSTNNFINFCIDKTLTNGQQVKGGSCNSVPMGDLPSTGKMPSSKFTSPANLDTIPANKAFTVKMAVKNMDTGNFVNPQTNYFGAPQQLNNQGIIVAHSHIVIEQISSLTSTAVSDPNKFAFFQGLNAPAKGGVLSATVTGGLPAGVYKISSINTSANHAPVVGPVAQHGSFDDVIYITVGGGGGNGGGNGGGKGKGKKFVRRLPSRDGKARL
jgi:transcription initiation factor TFIID subunit 15